MPIFVLLVFVGAALLWLLLSFGFIPIGKLSNRLLKDASDAMSKDEKDEKIEDMLLGILLSIFVGGWMAHRFFLSFTIARKPQLC